MLVRLYTYIYGLFIVATINVNIILDNQLSMKDHIGKLVRQKRPKAKDGSCRDTAKVTIVKNGVKRVFSLGRWNSPEANKAFKKLMVDYYTDTIELDTESITVSDFCMYYWEHAEPIKSDPGRYRTKLILKFASDDCGLIPCSKINFNTITVVKERIVSEGTVKGWTKAYANQLLSIWKRILIYGVMNNWIDSQLLPLIKAYPPITENLKPLQTRTDVNNDVIEHTLRYMSPMYADIIRLIRSACLRPTELFRLRKQDIEIKNGQWVAHIPSKTERFGYSRIVVFTEYEISILQKWIKDEGIIFPCTARYLSVVVSKAIKKANANDEYIPKWTPYQLRHTAFTENVKKYGIEVASKLAGHSSLNMARIYDHSTESILLELAKHR